MTLVILINLLWDQRPYHCGLMVKRRFGTGQGVLEISGVEDLVSEIDLGWRGLG